jgi:hypothetical protein
MGGRRGYDGRCMRLFLASLIFLATVLDMNFGAAANGLHAAALVAGLLLALSVVADFLWLDRAGERTRPPSESSSQG